MVPLTLAKLAMLQLAQNIAPYANVILDLLPVADYAHLPLVVMLN
jgi:hypothetical protein